MTSCEFFVEGHIESGNRRQRTHWGARYRAEKLSQNSWGLQIQAMAPGAVFVDSPHSKRTVSLLVRRKRSLDLDNLVAGLKPFIDMLRCRFFRGHTKDPRMLVWKGIIYDDAPKYVDWKISQEPCGGRPEGILVRVEGI